MRAAFEAAGILAGYRKAMIWFLCAVSMASPIVGVDYTPLGRQDLAWIEEEQLSGTLVGEFDGLVTSPLEAWGGYRWTRFAVTGGLGLAWVSTSTWDGQDRSLVVTGTLRPSVDGLWYITPEPDDLRPRAHASLGGYGLIPAATRQSDAFTDEEQDAADTEAESVRSRIGGLGLRLGAGVDLTWNSGLMLGLGYSFVAHRSQLLTEETSTTSLLIWGEAAFVFGFEL